MADVQPCNQQVSNSGGRPVAPLNLGGRPVLIPALYLDPKVWALESFQPPKPRDPDPAPPPPPTPPLPPPFPVLTNSWTGVDAYWWATLIRANSGNLDDSFVQRTLSAKGTYRRFVRITVQETPDILVSWWCRMNDRFIVGIEGTRTITQALNYVFTHALGNQTLIGSAWFNSTWVQQALYHVGLIANDWQAEGFPPLLIIGHSYGGAVVAPFYLALTNGRTSSFDQLVTMGNPINVTRSAEQALGGIKWIRFANRGDLVANLPPPQLVCNLISGVVSRGPYPGGDYYHPYPTLEMQEDGGALQRPRIDLDVVPWAQFMTSFLLGGADLEPHFARQYARLGRIWNDNSPITAASNFANYLSLYGINDDLAASGV